MAFWLLRKGKSLWWVKVFFIMLPFASTGRLTAITALTDDWSLWNPIMRMYSWLYAYSDMVSHSWEDCVCPTACFLQVPSQSKDWNFLKCSMNHSTAVFTGNAPGCTCGHEQNNEDCLCVFEKRFCHLFRTKCPPKIYIAWTCEGPYDENCFKHCTKRKSAVQKKIIS